MARINPHFQEISESYLFSEIAKRTRTFSDAHPDVEILSLGVGNTTEPLSPSVVEGLQRGVEKLSKRETYTGYGDEQGNYALRSAIAGRYARSGITLDPSEIFISDGAKTDCANIASIFSDDSVIAVSDPVYPVYRDANMLAGRKVVYMDATEKSGRFLE